MFRTLLALFRPLHVIARELTTIRELYEIELSERRVSPNWIREPLMRVTEKPKKGDVEISYQGDTVGPRYKQIDWSDEDEFDEHN